MPLVTVIHSRECSPSWKEESFGLALWKLCESLPERITEIVNRENSRYGSSGHLGLTDTRIVFVEHGPFDINPADVHFLVELNVDFSKGQCELIRDILAIIIREKIGHLVATIVLEVNVVGWCGARIEGEVITST